MALTLWWAFITVILKLASVAEGAYIPYKTKPLECTNVQASGYLSSKTDVKVYIYCDVKTKIGVKLTCMPAGYEWNNRLQTCVPPEYNKATNQCLPKVATTAQGTWTCDNDNKIGSQCQLACTKGNENTGVNEITCLGAGAGSGAKWNKMMIPNCVDKCVPNPCVMGSCSKNSDGNFICSCTSGWEGTRCDKVTNNCKGKDCGTFGFCVNKIGNHQCVCNPGYKGAKCDVKELCGEPIAALGILNAKSVDNAKFDFQTKITITCDAGYSVVGQTRGTVKQEIECGADTKWTPSMQCEVVDCGAPTVSDGSAATPTGTKFDKEATITCNTGYSVKGAQTTTTKCGADGKWADFSCEAHDCGKPTIADTEIKPGTTKFGDKREVSCPKSKVVKSTKSQKGEIECKLKSAETENSGWTKFPGCDAVDCGTPPTPRSPAGVTGIGSITYVIFLGHADNQNNYEAKVDLKCKPNYKLKCTTDKTKNPPACTVAPQLTCDYEGWTPTGTPECEGLACDNDFAKNFENGEITFTDTNKVNSVATITCSSGYVIEGKTDITLCMTCNANSANTDAVYAPVSQKCVKRTCPPLADPTGGSLDKKTGSYQDKVTVTCNEGFFPYPPENAASTCSATGNWVPVPAKCQSKSCDAITITNGIIKVNGEVSILSVPVKSKVTFECIAGFALSSAGVELTCSDVNGAARGTYGSGIAPTCSNIDDCKGVDCGGEHGNCKDGIDNYECSCNAGWEKETPSDPKGKCTKEVNPCVVGPCKNSDGVKVDGESGCFLNQHDYVVDGNQFQYYCDCSETRYSGYNCQKDTQATVPTTCTGSGYLPHPRSCTKYYKCQFDIPREESCVHGQVYDSTKKYCVLPASAAKESLCTRNGKNNWNFG